MESHAKYLIVGVTVIVVTVMVVVAVLWIAEVGGEHSTKFYTTYFKEHSLDGLQIDSDVTMKGIKVGSVDAFSISSTDIERVRVTLRMREDTPIKTDTRAVIRRNLLTGLATIDLIRSTQGSKFLERVDLKEEFPVISEGRTELGAIADSIPGLIEDVGDMISRAKGFLNDENRVALKNTFANLQRFTKVLADNDQRFTEMIQDVTTLTHELSEMSKQLKAVTAIAERQMENVSGELVETLREIKGVASELGERISSVSASVKNAADVISLETTNVSQDISTAAQSFSRTLERFDDPKALILGPREEALGPGERILE